MNDKIFFFFYNLAHTSVFFDKTVIFFAETLPYIFIFLIFCFFLQKDNIFNIKKIFEILLLKWRNIFLVLIAGIVAYLFSYVLKIIIHLPRPFVKFDYVVSLFRETGFAFPSGHATFFMALAFGIFFQNKKFGYFFIILAILIGLARIIAGVHFPVDILGGFVLGAIVATGIKFANLAKNV